MIFDFEVSFDTMVSTAQIKTVRTMELVELISSIYECCVDKAYYRGCGVESRGVDVRSVGVSVTF